MNVQSTLRPPPKMTEAFEHPAGSIAASKAGGATQWQGKLLHIHVAPSASYEMEELQEAECVAGRGIVGDRYYEGTGTYSPKPDVREVTLIEQEALDALSRNDPPLQDGPITLEPRDHRRNLTVIGVPLNHLVGRRFQGRRRHPARRPVEFSLQISRGTAGPAGVPSTVQSLRAELRHRARRHHPARRRHRVAGPMTARLIMKLRVAKMRLTTPDVLHLQLVHPLRPALPEWSAGAHVDLRMPDGRVRQYSLCGDPDDTLQIRDCHQARGDGPRRIDLGSRKPA